MVWGVTVGVPVNGNTQVQIIIDMKTMTKLLIHIWTGFCGELCEQYEEYMDNNEITRSSFWSYNALWMQHIYRPLLVSYFTHCYKYTDLDKSYYQTNTYTVLGPFWDKP